MNNKTVYVLSFVVTFLLILIYWQYDNKNARAGQFSQILVQKHSKTSKNIVQCDHEAARPIKSAFYGMNHIETYGMPLSYFGINKSFDKMKKNWKLYFPEMAVGLKNLNSSNPTAIHSLSTHSFKVDLAKTNYVVGEELFAVVTALNKKGKPKHFGGDFYRARLIKEHKPLQDGIPCRVSDNMDGTYNVQAPLLFHGLLTLEVKLILSIEGIKEFLDKSDGLPRWGVNYTAKFENKETSICNFDISVPDRNELCDYSNPRNKEPWFCIKPPSKTCPKIVYMHLREEKPLIDFDKINLKYNFNKMVKVPVKVGENSKYLTMKKQDLSQCRHEYFSGYTVFNDIIGFWKDAHWHLLKCASPINSSSLPNCFKNKVVYFFGDSTMRQFFYHFATILELQVEEGAETTLYWHQPKYAHDVPVFPHQNLNVSVFYRAHGPPLRNHGPSYTRPYISDSITDLPEGGQDVYVVFNIGAHLRYVNPNLYLHRIKGIRKAIIDHQDRFPDTKFIVRGMNTVESVGNVKNVNWQVYRIEILLRNVFSGMKNVVFLNFWDMTTVSILPDIHPHDNDLKEQAIYMAKYICS